MARKGMDMLQQIESDALDPASDIATVLRKCIALGGATGSESLRDWASRELKGYETDDELPSYRRIVAPLLLDAVLGGSRMVQGQTVPPALIPEFAQETVGTTVSFPQPIAEIAGMITAAEGRGDRAVQLGPPGGPHLVQLINAQLAASDQSGGSFYNLPPSQLVERIYWSVSLAPLRRIVDVVRTTLVELVAEMRAGTPADQATPSRETAEQAVSVAVHGKRHRVVINQIAPGGVGAATAAGAAAVGTEPASRTRSLVWWLVAIATIVAAVAAVWALFLT